MNLWVIFQGEHHRRTNIKMHVGLPSVWPRLVVEDTAGYCIVTALGLCCVRQGLGWSWNLVVLHNNFLLRDLDRFIIMPPLL